MMVWRDIVTTKMLSLLLETGIVNKKSMKVTIYAHDVKSIVVRSEDVMVAQDEEHKGTSVTPSVGTLVKLPDEKVKNAREYQMIVRNSPNENECDHKRKDDVQNTKNMQRRFVLLEKYGGRK